MKLEVLRISSQEDSTSGILFDVTDNKRKFLCYTVEDEFRAEKIKHETRIPAGTYTAMPILAGIEFSTSVAMLVSWRLARLSPRPRPAMSYLPAF